MATTDDTLSVVRAYHAGWTSKNFGQSVSLLARTLEVEVPINDYPTTESFAEALIGFGSAVTNVRLRSELAEGSQAMLLYDMDVDGLGEMRVAEHFTVADNRITRIRQIHDTAPLRAAGFEQHAEDSGNGAVNRVTGYESRVTLRAARGDVFAAVTTLEGLRGWWTTLVKGSPASGGELRFEFEGVDEYIDMRVDCARRSDRVEWCCLTHTSQPDWDGTKLTFDLVELDPTSCELSFQHSGLAPECVDAGWDHFLGSLAAYVEQGEGTPFGSR